MSDQDDESPAERLDALRFRLSIAESRVRARMVGHRGNDHDARLAADRLEAAAIADEIAALERQVRATAEAEAAELEQRRAELAALLPRERFKKIQHTAGDLQRAAEEIDTAFATARNALIRAAGLCEELEFLTGDENLAAQLAEAWRALPALAAYYLEPAGVEAGTPARRGSFASRLPRPADFDESGPRPRRRAQAESDDNRAPDLRRALSERGLLESEPAAPGAKGGPT